MRVLLCVDGSPDAARATEHLKQIIKAKDEVFILHAWKSPDLPPTVHMIGPLPIVAPQPFSQFPLQQFKERKHFENESRAILREAARQLVEEGELDDQIFTVSREAKAPKDAIVAEAVARDVDLIVMGRRGLGPLKQVFVGSNSLHVAKHAHCSVMVVH